MKLVRNEQCYLIKFRKLSILSKKDEHKYNFEGIQKHIGVDCNQILSGRFNFFSA